MFRLIAPALVAGAVGSLAAGASAQELAPPPPDFLSCRVTGRQTICSGSQVTVREPYDTEIVCGSGASAFHIWDQGTVHQHVKRYYDSAGRLTRRVNHERWDPAWFSNPLTGATAPYHQSNTIVTALAVPGDFGSATETNVGQAIFHGDPGGVIFRSTGRFVIGPDGAVEFRSGKQDFLDALVDGDTSVLEPLCAALA